MLRLYGGDGSEVAALMTPAEHSRENVPFVFRFAHICQDSARLAAISSSLPLLSGGGASKKKKGPHPDPRQLLKDRHGRHPRRQLMLSDGAVTTGTLG